MTIKHDLSSFETRLSLAMRQANISKYNLSVLLDVSPSTISGWFNGKKPSLKNLKSLSTALNLSMDWLVCGHGPMHLHGPLHLKKSEQQLVLKTRKLPVDCISKLLEFLARLLSTNPQTLVDRANASHTLSLTHLPMFIDNHENRLFDANAMLLDFLKISYTETDQLQQKSILDFILEEDRPHFFYHSRKCMEQQNHGHFNCRLIPMGSDKPVTVAISRVYHGSKDKGFFFTTLFPIPEKTSG